MLLRYDPGKEDEFEEGEEVEEGDEDEDDTRALNDIQHSLFEELLDVNEARSWASYGPIQHNLPIPGLHLGQGGVDALVGLPLSSTDASRINQHASQCGLESNPSVDDNDLPCNLDPSQFELRNPSWQTAAKMLGMEATRPFDIGPATVQLRRLTLSGPSRPLKLLQDPYPDPAAFGSLMIVLPSLHSGGDIKLSYGNETNRFSTATTSEFGYSFVAWFSDVRLELDPISSGYRLHLIYDLYSPRTQLGVTPSTSWLSERATTYKSMLEQWSRLRENDGNSSPLVAFILEDEGRDYQHGRLSYEQLNKYHTHKARFLQQQCIETRVCFWLARMSTSFDSRGYGASESIFKLDRISELDGTEVVEGIVLIDKEDIVEIDSFESREANDSDYDWETDDTIYYFKDWVFLLLPESQRMQFLVDNMSGRELRQRIARRSNLLQSSGTQADGVDQPTNVEEQRKELAFMCRHVMSGPDDPTFSKTVELVVRATLLARQVSLFGSAVRKCPSTLSQAMWRKVGEEFNDDDVLYGGYRERLDVALSRVSTLTARYTIIENILSGYLRRAVKPDDGSLKLWARGNMVSALSSLSHSTEEDSMTLAAIEEKYGKDILMERRLEKTFYLLTYLADYLDTVGKEADVVALQDLRKELKQRGGARSH